MGKSKKLAIFKNKCSKHNVYHRIVRTNINQKLRGVKDIMDAEELELPNSKELVSDWSYCDNILDYEYTITDVKKKTEKMRRK